MDKNEKEDLLIGICRSILVSALKQIEGLGFTVIIFERDDHIEIDSEYAEQIDILPNLKHR